MSSIVLLFVLVTMFIVLDLVTGIVKALMEKNFNSSTMRMGLFHKCGSVLCILFGELVDYTQQFFDLGVGIPVLETICVYIILMEIGSIIENLCKINPDILPNKIKSMFAKLRESEGEA